MWTRTSWPSGWAGLLGTRHSPAVDPIASPSAHPLSFCAVQGGAMAVGGVDNRFFEGEMRNLAVPHESRMAPAPHTSARISILKLPNTIQ